VWRDSDGQAITDAARALAVGDPLGALNRVALRDDAPALALRGTAMAQLGDFVRAKTLLRRAGRAFGPNETVARARCVIAEAEIALVSRDLGWPAKSLDAARATLEEHGDRLNAAHARYLEVRRLWVGRYEDRKIYQVDPQTGTILRTIESNRFVTGITWVDGELWHGTWEGGKSELRRVDSRTGEVLESLEMPPGMGLSGIESDGGDLFFCGGGRSGKVRTVRRPKRGSASRRESRSSTSK